ncbi:MAG: magnesium chelatase [Patescibacteria group bacterium]
MISKLKSFTLSGIFPEIVEIEIGLSVGLSSFQIVGLPDQTVNESKERIGLALKSIGAKPPQKFNRKIVVNLAPADIKKEGPLLDLPIALCFLLATGQIKNIPEKTLFLGELGLDGSLKKIKGVLPIALKAKEYGFEKIVLPKENLKEVSFLDDLQFYGFENLKEVIKFLEGEEFRPYKEKINFDFNEEDLSFLIIDDYLLRGLMIAALGRHNFLLYGPPGTGKTLIAKNFVNLLPNLRKEESLEVSSIYSALGLLNEGIVFRPPFRSPHHSASTTSILGGGKDAKPGEVTLAHRGVLFFDELPEFRRDVLEGIREPMENGEIVVSRAKKVGKYPAKFIFIGAYNPCPCGFYGDPEIECKCTISEINKYQRKISGPIFDRIDMNFYVPRMKSEKIFNMEKRDFKKIKEKLKEAQERMKKFFGDDCFYYPSEIPPNKINKYIQLTNDAEKILRDAIDRFRISLRGVHKILKVSLTITFLENKDKIDKEEILEALQYRFQTNET